MITLFCSLFIGILTFFSTHFLFGIIPSIFPGVILFVVFYFLISKKISSKIELEIQTAYKKIQNRQFKNSINTLIAIKKRYHLWQFFISSSISGQIGTIYYMQQKFSEAEPFLRKSFVKHWTSKVMLGILEFKKKNYSKMDQIFERTVRYSPKEGLLWSTWAFCHYKIKNNNRAIQILVQGKKKLRDKDILLLDNILNLQNKKRMKMKGYGEQWFQFQLEISPIMKKMRSGNIRFKRR